MYEGVAEIYTKIILRRGSNSARQNYLLPPLIINNPLSQQPLHNWAGENLAPGRDISTHLTAKALNYSAPNRDPAQGLWSAPCNICLHLPPPAMTAPTGVRYVAKRHCCQGTWVYQASQKLATWPKTREPTGLQPSERFCNLFSYS